MRPICGREGEWEGEGEGGREGLSKRYHEWGKGMKKDDAAAREDREEQRLHEKRHIYRREAGGEAGRDDA